VRRAGRIALGLLVGLLVALASGWAAMALWIDGPASRPLAGTLVGGVLVGTVALPALLRPARRGLALWLALWLAVLGWWLSIPPRADRDWQPDVARLPSAEIRGDLVTIRNVRDFDYRSETDYTERWEDRTYDLSRLSGVDAYLSFWGPTLIAHTIISWDFDDGRHLAVSIETRKEKGEEYSAIRGFFRQFELYYVVADERDVVRLRTNYRGEQVYLYRLGSTREFARAFLLSYLEEVNELAREPAWYNAFTKNCTTAIRFQVQQAGVHNPWNWRLLVNGKADELLYMRGNVNTSLPFPELRERSDITERARAAGTDPEFSRLIREGLPPRPGAG
jgi:hypothetical protein